MTLGSRIIDGVEIVAKNSLQVVAKYELLSHIVSNVLISMRETKLNNPKEYERQLKRTMFWSKFHDRFTWQVVSSLYKIRHFVALNFGNLKLFLAAPLYLHLYMHLYIALILVSIISIVL